MNEPNKDSQDLKEYAGGWMTERKHTEIPGFLKLATPIIALGGVAYLVLQMYGDIHNAERGGLVAQFNKVSHPSPAVSYTVAALVLVYAIIISRFVFSKHKED
jgi:uncharacterized membrane protein YebE (DUF533 family)